MAGWEGLVHRSLSEVASIHRACRSVLARRCDTHSRWPLVQAPCESLAEVIRKLHDQAGIEAAGATSARRTIGVHLHCDG